MDEKERSAKIRELSKPIVEEKIADSHYNARVKSFFGGKKSIHPVTIYLSVFTTLPLCVCDHTAGHINVSPYIGYTQIS